MMSLFSSFDMTFYKLSLIMFIVASLNSLSFSFKMSIANISMYLMKTMMEKFYISMNKQMMKSVNLTLFSLFSLIFLLNFTSVLSFNFAYTTQLSITMFISLSLWMTIMMFKYMKSYKSFLSHCIPEGTPMSLVWFLFMVEVVSNVIRPLTVTVRLVANIVAGHLLMILLSKLVFSFNFMSISYFMLNLVEMFVALIQAYIYSTMICLYLSEVE